MMRSRYGVGGGASLNPTAPTLSQGVSPTPTMAPVAPAGPAAALDERPLRVILQVDFVKPKPAAPEGARKAAAAPRANPEATAGDPADDAPASPQ